MVNVRIASAQDASTVHSLICELARYEKLLDEVTATPESIQKSLFGERPDAEVIIAEVDDKPVGFILFFHNYSTFLSSPGIYIEDFFVMPEYRKKQVGLALAKYIVTLAKERNCKRIEGAVLHWNEPSMEVFAKMGAKKMNDWILHRLDARGIDQLAKSFGIIS